MNTISIMAEFEIQTDVSLYCFLNVCKWCFFQNNTSQVKFCVINEGIHHCTMVNL